jgi:hypothetical protein
MASETARTDLATIQDVAVVQSSSTYQDLALALVTQGYKVSVLYTGDLEKSKDLTRFEALVEAQRAQGVELLA